MFGDHQRVSGSRRRSGFLFVGAVLLTVVVVLSGAGSSRGIAAARANTPSTGGRAGAAQVPSAWTDTTIPMSAESAIQSLGAGTYASSYGGVAVINNQTQLAVYLTTPTASIEKAFGDNAPSGMIVFRSTPNSLQTIDAVHQQLESEWQSLLQQGIKLVDFGPNPYLGQEDVGVENLTSAQTQQLQSQFPQGTLHIYNETPADVNSRTTQSLDREHDVAPYNGGDNIANVSMGGCTSGFGVEVNGTPEMVSAGHCFNVGASVVNLKCDPSSCSQGSGNEMGTVTGNGLGNLRQNLGNNTLDSLLFTGCNDSGTCGGDGIIWTGALDNPQRANVSGIASWVAGDQLCESGAYGGEKCDFTVAETSHCATINPYYLCGITSLHVTGGDPSIDGDSGGPWFRFSGSNLEIAGTHTGYNPNNNLEYFTGIHHILPHWNACLITVGFGCVT